MPAIVFRFVGQTRVGFFHSGASVPHSTTYGSAPTSMPDHTFLVQNAEYMMAHADYELKTHIIFAEYMMADHTLKCRMLNI